MSNLENNLKKLLSTDFWGLISTVAMEQSQGKIVSYLTLTVNQINGEIVEIAPKVRYYENTLTAPVAIERENILAKPSDLRLRLIQLKDEEWPDNIRKSVELAFSKFNEEQRKNSLKIDFFQNSL